MSDVKNDQAFPRGALASVTALIIFALLAVAFAKITSDNDRPNLVTDKDITKINRDLRFEDRDGGIVVVYDANRNVKVTTLQPGTENFIRGVLRGLVRERRSRKLGDESPFRLMQTYEGQLVLEDLATNRQINLNAFGKTNAGAFARLLKVEEST